MPEYFDQCEKGGQLSRDVCRPLHGSFFDAVAVSIWEEDISAVLQCFSELKKEDVSDLDHYIDEHPGFLEKAVKMVRIVSVNQATLSLYEAGSIDELLGSLDKVFTQQSYIAFRKVLVAIFKEESRFEAEATNKTLTGKTLSVILSCTIPRLKSAPDTMFVSIIDITARRKAEEALRSQEKQYRIFSSIASDYVFICEKHDSGPYRLLWMAGAVESITGYQEEELLTKMTWLDLVHPDDREQVAFKVEKNVPGVKSVERLRIITKSGGIKWVKLFLRCEPGECAGTLRLYCAAQDITAQELLHEQILKNQKIESIGTLAGGIAHDFNNILSAIMGNISLAKMFSGNPLKLDNALESAEAATKRAAQLAGQLLTFAKGGKPVKKTVSVKWLVNEVLSFSLRGSNVKGSLSIPESIHALEADEGQLYQALNNLFLNAIEAMPDGGTITVQAENIFLIEDNLYSLDPGDYVSIIIADEGCGISAENLERIFDPYFTTKQIGTGLGLASVYSIINRHGGCITVSSREGAGTTFALYLPSLGTVFAENAGMASSRTLRKVTPFCGTVLIMDDEELIRFVAAEFLTVLGFSVSTCNDGEAAVNLYLRALEAGEPFDCVLMDLTVPGGMGGREAAKRILSIDQSAKIIASSGYSEDEVMANHKHFGFVNALGKPYDLIKLKEAICTIEELS